MNKPLLFLSAISSLLFSQSVFGQFKLDGQLIQRAEFRNGFSKLIPENQSPAGFIAQRARLQASYQSEPVNFYMSIQDIRVWGNTPQVKLTDTFLSVHEAYAELPIGDSWKIKLGRQELNYDNFRFLGNLDWALQARAHDFALIKQEQGNRKIHFGAGYNQDAMHLSGNLFETTNQYKYAQLFRYENKWEKLQLSMLFWNDGRQYIERDNTGTIIQDEVYHRQTIGLPTVKYQFGQTLLTGFYYQQFGKDPMGRKSSGYDINVQASQQIPLKSQGKKLKFAAGIEILSGTPTNDLSENKSFSPLYGTNHLYNGYMDLFYVGGTHENNVGLTDIYLKGRHDFNPSFFIQTDAHFFSSQADVYTNFVSGELMDKRLGTEIDLSFGLVFNQAISLQGGYSQFFHSDTMEHIHANGQLKNLQNWAYLMLIVRPTMPNKFIGILF
ncbi:hypothetical protein SAMN04488057_11428 [Cyclobacterium lianum]|uniref:Alginate export n=1 Tax=Cyclobacterium lianum TaxID=388280 RepID=A0A1M7Q558_9BACT|nr:hypothetical protein [Cyclobacterium lianum]SHN25483.1 hypothetical protein SAMN04488057_11428 [Cyclobacterium lianum]